MGINSVADQLFGPSQDERTQNREFRVLAVCTGNVARSPIIERLLQARLDSLDEQAFRVGSAGTRALVGHSMTSSARSIVADNNGTTEGFRSRQLTGSLLDDADLVVTASREHLRYVIELRPNLLLRTFLFVELARLAQTVEIDDGTDLIGRCNDLVRAVARQRRSAVDADDEIVDPMGKSPEVYQEVASLIVPAVQSLANVIGGLR